MKFSYLFIPGKKMSREENQNPSVEENTIQQ